MAWRVGLLVLLAIALITLAALLLLARVMPGGYFTESVPDQKFVELADGVVRYQDLGTGKTALILLHGFNGNLANWDEVWDYLEDCGVRRVRLDIPGFGQSGWASTDYGLVPQADRIMRFLDALGIDKATLVGTSMGASLSATIAARFPERVSQIALLAPSGYPDGLHYPGLYGRLLAPGWPRQLALRVAQTRLYGWLFPGSKARQALSVTSSYGDEWARSLEQIRAPAFIAWSQGDATVRPQTAEQVHSKINGSTLLWVDDKAGHDISATRPRTTATIACSLARGESPAAIAAALQNRDQQAPFD